LEADCLRVAAEIAARENKLHILVNNAGSTWGAPFEQFPDAAWDRVLHLNLKAVFELTRALLPLLQAAGSPNDPARVVNIGSIDGIRISDTPHYSYSASKAAVHMLTRVLASELAARQVTVNAIAAGPFATRMTKAVLESPEAQAIAANVVPLKRIGAPHDAAGLVIFLCSKAGSFVTGSIIPLDGGILVGVTKPSL
jgi:NAD(P)-dependent dehydrogenase (short-subunit alcohol dehydrogenase family)